MRLIFAAALAGAGLLLASCETGPPVPAEPIPTEEQRVEPETFSYQCPDGFSFQVVLQVEAIDLVLPDTTLALQRVDAPSGARYLANGSEYWSRDAEALIEIPGEIRHGCIPERATPAW